MKDRLLVGLLLVCILASAAVYGVYAQTTPVLGIKEGDKFTYMFTVNWNSADANDVVPQEFSDMNKTLSIGFNVTSAVGYMANLDITTTLRDGTHTTESGYIEVARGGSVGASLFVIGANLTAGDQVYPQSDPAAVKVGQAAAPFKITETLNKTYLGTSRTVNHYVERVTNTTTGDYVDRSAYYDQATGVLMEMKIEHYWATLGETDSEHWDIVQFNSAQAPSDGTNDGGNGNGSDSNDPLQSWIVPLAIVAVVVVVVATLATMLVLRKRRKADVQERPQTSPRTPV